MTHDSALSLILTKPQMAALYRHAQEAQPEECCGWLGGTGRAVRSVYRLRNVARDPLVAYEADPVELFAAQRQMRERGETLLGIYHSHPRQADPVPSATDVRRAYYPAAVYFIIGLGGVAPALRAFRLNADAERWIRVEYEETAE